MECPRCGSKIPEASEVCQECGNNLELPCPLCGRMNKQGNKVCSECGFHLSNTFTLVDGG